jgi:AraC-like DNA-binding protein
MAPDNINTIPTRVENNEEKDTVEKLLLNIKHLQELSSQVLGYKQMQIEVRNSELVIRLPWQKSRGYSSQYPSNPVSFTDEPDEEFPGKKREVSKIDSDFIRELNKVMKRNYPDPEFNVEQLAKKLHISPSSLYRKIRTYYGVTPCKFICSYRLERAAQVLKKNNAPVIDVAYDVGFSSRPYFTKCFKKKFQQLPSHFSKSLQSS